MSTTLGTAGDAASVREPGSLPFPDRPAGTVDEAMPFDHIVVVMMENHSFDNALGVLPRSGQPAADGVRDPHAQERSTSASARHGDPEPLTIGSGPAITTAPVTGSRARFCSCVRPYLPAPSKDE